MQRWRQKKRAGAAYHTLKHHAKSRGIPFTLTPDYFAGLADAFCYFDQNGGKARGDVLSIDRIDPTRGYEPGNCRVVSHSANASKGARERYLPEHVQSMLMRRRAIAQAEAERYLAESAPDDDPNLPF
jgi:hypothetical protein